MTLLSQKGTPEPAPLHGSTEFKPWGHQGNSEFIFQKETLEVFPSAEYLIMSVSLSNAISDLQAFIDYLQVHCVALRSLRLQGTEVKNKLKKSDFKNR